MRKKKIKILHVAQAAGGVDRYIRMLLKYLDRCVWNQRITLFQCISGNPHCIFLVRFGLAKIHVSEFLDLVGINHTNREPGFLKRFQNRIVVMPGIFH